MDFLRGLLHAMELSMAPPPLSVNSGLVLRQRSWKRINDECLEYSEYSDLKDCSGVCLDYQETCRLNVYLNEVYNWILNISRFIFSCIWCSSVRNMSLTAKLSIDITMVSQWLQFIWRLVWFHRKRSGYLFELKNVHS